MPKCIIDGREVEFSPGENLIEVAKKGGIEIPYFCYHPGLTVVAQCRMCAVEVEKMPKLQTACSTPATDGMVVKTKSERTIQNQKSVMEFLLINHPLDCPICDKAGECDLQEQSYVYGDPYSRFVEEKRTYVDLDMGPVIKKNMNRCIHCTRCIRFGEEVAGIHEMISTNRGGRTEISTLDGRPLETEYAGNYADICPTGSLSLKDFRFKKRVWFLKKTPTVCEGCSKGCNMEIHQSGNVIYRCVPRENQEINKWWLCDEGRFNFHYVHHPERILAPAVRQQGNLQMTDWNSAITAAKEQLYGKKSLILIGADLTQEEATQIQKFAHKQFPTTTLQHYGTPGVISSKNDAPADKLLKRKSKTSNLNGLEKLGISPFEGKIPVGVDGVLVFSGGRAILPELKGVAAVGIGVFLKDQAAPFSAILPGPSFAEKDGTIFNFEGREQKFKKAIEPLGKTKDISEILSYWTGEKVVQEGVI